MPQILVEVKPNTKQKKIEKITDGVYKVHLSAPPTEGKANKQLVEMLAEYFDVAKSLVEIKAGKSARTKVVIIR